MSDNPAPSLNIKIEKSKKATNSLFDKPINAKKPTNEPGKPGINIQFNHQITKHAPSTHSNAQQNKPALPKIERANQNKKAAIVFEWPRKNQYTIEEARRFREAVRDFLHKTESKKISDEQFIQMSALLSRFKFSQRKKVDQGRQAKPPNRNELEKQEHKIISELNKLTIDNFMLIVDNLTTREDNFLQKSYLEMLAKNLVNQASLQPLFSDLYSLCASSISQVLNNSEFAESRNTFCHTIQTNSRDAVKKELQSNAKFASEAAVGSSSFYGFLANRDFLPIQSVFDLVIEGLQDPTPLHIEIVRQLLLPAGKKIDEKIPESKTKIFDVLVSISKNKEIPGSVRYPLLDLLEARSNNWDIKELVHHIVSAKTLSAAASSSVHPSATQKGYQKEQKPTITAGSNAFAALMDDDEDDEEFYEEEEELGDFDGEDMVRRYVVDNEISPSWRKSYVGELFFAIALRPEKDIRRAMNLLQELNENNDFVDNEAAFQAICDTAQRCFSEEVMEKLPNAISNCGSIFARLCSLNCVSVDQFADVFPLENYKVNIVISFLKEIVKVKKTTLLRESEFWNQYKWRPENCNHLEIAQQFADFENSDILFDLFPLYDFIMNLFDAIDLTVNPEENNDEDEAPNLESVLEEIPPDVLSMPAFAIGAIEILVHYIDNMSFFETVLPSLKENELSILLWVEQYGIREYRDVDTVVKLIKQVAKCGKFNIDSFKNHAGNEKHQEIVQKLK